VPLEKQAPFGHDEGMAFGRKGNISRSELD
jgi:hypothetical protein